MFLQVKSFVLSILLLHVFLLIKAEEKEEPIDSVAFKEATKMADHVVVLLNTLPDSVPLFIQQGLNLSEKANSHKLKGRFLELQGKYYIQSNDFLKANDFFMDAIAAYKTINYKRGISSVYNELGIFYLNIGEVEKAEEYFDLSMSNLESESDKAIVSVNISNAYVSMGELGKAMELLLLSKQIFEDQHKDNFLSSVIANIANICFKQGNHIEAIQYCDTAISLKDSVVNWRQVMNCKIGKAASYRSMGNYDKARTILLNISKSKINDSDYNSFGLIYFELGLIEYGIKNYKQAEKQYLKSLESYKKANNGIRQAEIYHELGKIMLYQKMNQKAIHYLTQSLKMSEKYLAQSLLLKNYEELINLYKSQGNYKQAFSLQESYFTLKGKYTVEAQKKEISFYESKVKLNQKEIELKELVQKNKENLLLIEKGKYQKILLLALIVLLSLSGIVTFLSARIKHIRRQKQLENQKLEIENKLLRSQLNPHFIFNCLNSAQAYISENKLHDAAVFLSNFARLIRNTLNVTRNDLVPFNEELEILELYLKIEQERFNNRFNFEIICQPDINTEKIMVPPFMTQPFIENALIHGIAKSKRKGLISIHYKFFEDEKLIQCQVIDNGGGVNSNIIAHKNWYESVGSKLIQERLQIYQKDYKRKLEFTLKDGKSEQGTEVDIIYPYFDINQRKEK